MLCSKHVFFPLWIKQHPKYPFHKRCKGKSLWITEKFSQAYSQLCKENWLFLFQELFYFSVWIMTPMYDSLDVHSRKNIYFHLFYIFHLLPKPHICMHSFSISESADVDSFLILYKFSLQCIYASCRWIRK